MRKTIVSLLAIAVLALPAAGKTPKKVKTNDNGNPFPIYVLAHAGNIVGFGGVVELEIYGIVHMSELVNVVETYL